jgi:hypothetical protein
MKFFIEVGKAAFSSKPQPISVSGVEPVDKFYDHWGASLQAKVLHSL